MKKRFIFVFISIFLLAGCSANPESNTPASNPQASSVPAQVTQVQAAEPAKAQNAPSLTADEVYKAVSAAWAKLGTAGPRHISQTTSKGMSTEYDLVPPDYHQVISAGGKVVAEQFAVGGTLYNNAQGAWSQIAGAGKVLNTIGTFSSGLSDSLVYSDGMVNGVEVINGSPAIVYSYKTTLKGQNASAKYKLWVDQTSGLPVKSENITADGMTIAQTITYDNNIKITLSEEAKNAPVKQ
jgi:hypothetical protein